MAAPAKVIPSPSMGSSAATYSLPDAALQQFNTVCSEPALYFPPGFAEVGCQVEPRKRKPKQEVPMSCNSPPLRATTPAPGVLLVEPVSTVSGHKRRGRPPGSGRKDELPSHGEWLFTGEGFTPHVITIEAGEDIVAKLMTFTQTGPRSVCILSASGIVSRVTLLQPGTVEGTVTHEGCFEILRLSGSFVHPVEGRSRGRNGDLCISLSNDEGVVIGGGVCGLLTAATPVQVIVGSFTYGSKKSKGKRDGRDDTPAAQHVPVIKHAPASSPMMIGGSRQRDTVDFHRGAGLT